MQHVHSKMPPKRLIQYVATAVRFNIVKPFACH